MDKFEIVLTQMPYVGGAASRMSDFFMRLMGFMAISRVLRRHGVSLSVIGEIERETYKAQLLTVPEAERLASGRQFMSSEDQTLLREQATKSHQKEFPKDSSTISSIRARVTTLNSASTTELAALANSRLAMEVKKSCRTFAGLISTLCNARHPPGKDTNVGWQREPLRFPILAAPVARAFRVFPSLA